MRFSVITKENLICQIIQTSTCHLVRWDANKNQLIFQHYKKKWMECMKTIAMTSCIDVNEATQDAILWCEIKGVKMK